MGLVRGVPAQDDSLTKDGLAAESRRKVPSALLSFFAVWARALRILDGGDSTSMRDAISFWICSDNLFCNTDCMFLARPRQRPAPTRGLVLGSLAGLRGGGGWNSGAASVAASSSRRRSCNILIVSGRPERRKKWQRF